MKFLRRWLAGLVGLVINLAGLAGSSDQVGNWAHWLGVVHHWLENPLVWITATLLGTALMAHSWGEYRAEHIVENAGGTTKREFPAHLKY